MSRTFHPAPGDMRALPTNSSCPRHGTTSVLPSFMINSVKWFEQNGTCCQSYHPVDGFHSWMSLRTFDIALRKWSEVAKRSSRGFTTQSSPLTAMRLSLSSPFSNSQVLTLGPFPFVSFSTSSGPITPSPSIILTSWTARLVKVFRA